MQNVYILRHLFIIIRLFSKCCIIKTEKIVFVHTYTKEIHVLNKLKKNPYMTVISIAKL